MLLTRRKLLQAGAAACAAPLLGCGTPPAAEGVPRLRLLGQSTLAHRLRFQGTTVGGLSAIDFDPATGAWVVLSDDRSALNPARFYTLRLDVADPALRVDLQSVVTLRQADGQPYPPRRLGGEVVDPEGLRLLPGGAGLLWTSEGDPRLGLHPSLHQAGLDGVQVRAFETPRMLQFPGPRQNHTFEGLALAPDAGTAWVAMEGALEQDGALPKVGTPGAPCRITAFDVAAGRAVRQIAYVPDAIPHRPLIPGGIAGNGISEILMIDAHRMLVLERAYSLGIVTSLRLYEIDTREASDTLAMAKLEPGGFRPAAKALVADFARLPLLRTDNTEGMTWGPTLPNGRRTLVVVSDDNFNPLQVTQFAAFEYLD